MTSRLLLAACAALVVHAPARAADGPLDLGFEDAFPRPFHQKRYVGAAVTGVSIVAVGALTYATAGAVAPAAVSGASTVAGWVAGGGAGTYVAGLSAIGGWLRGDASLGASILEAVVPGASGASGAFGSLDVAQKSTVLSSLASTALDGIAVLRTPGTSGLDVQSTLPVPVALASRRLGDLVGDHEAALRDLAAAAEALDGAEAADRKASPAGPVPSGGEGAGRGEGRAAPPASTKTLRLRREVDAQLAKAKSAAAQLEREIDRATAREEADRDTVVLAVLANNLGRARAFEQLLARLDRAPVGRAAYLDYLRAIDAARQHRDRDAQSLLVRSWDAAPFAIEPPSLLAVLLGTEGFEKHEGAILEVARRAGERFDDDRYAPRASRVSLHYRIGSMALAADRCRTALDAFGAAGASLSTLQKYWTGTELRTLVDVGVANAQHCLGRHEAARKTFDAAVKRAGTSDLALLCAQFRGCRP